MEDDNDFLPEFYKQLATLKNVGGLQTARENFEKVQLKPIYAGREDSLQQFLVAEVCPEFIFKSIQFHCKALWKDIVKLAQRIDFKNEILIGDMGTFKTTWATTIMVEKQLSPKNKAKERASQLYITLRSCGFVNLIANIITSFTLIMENEQEFLHYATVPIQFVDIANEYLLEYTVKLHFGTREVTKPWYQFTKISVYIPYGIHDTKMSLMRTRPEEWTLVDLSIVHSQFYYEPIEFPSDKLKEWRLDVGNRFFYRGYGFLLMIPYHRNWNVDFFSLLISQRKIPLYCKRISSSSNCMWLLLSTDEKTTINDIVDLKVMPKLDNLLDFTRLEDAYLIMSNSKQEYLSFPQDDENPSCTMWHHFNIYRNCSGCGGNLVCE